MSHSVTLALLRKDQRLLRPVRRAALVGAVLLYATLPAAQCATSQRWYGDPHETLRNFTEGVTAASLLFLLLTPLLCTAAGATAFATERRERWAEWTALLPVPRQALVASKLRLYGEFCLALLVLPVLATAVVALLWISVLRVGPQDASHDLLQNLADFWNEGMGSLVAVAVGTAVGLFGVAWLASSFLRSPALAAVLAVALVGTPVVWRLAQIKVAEQQNDLKTTRIVVRDPGHVSRDAQVWTAAVAFYAGLAALSVGGVVQCRRVSP